MPSHEILGGKVQVYKRENSPYWQCSASLDGRQYRTSTKRYNLPRRRSSPRTGISNCAASGAPVFSNPLS